MQTEPITQSHSELLLVQLADTVDKVALQIQLLQKIVSEYQI